MQPHTAYRDSGLEWISEVPEHWGVRRLTYSVIRSDVKLEPEQAEGMPYVGLEHVESWTGHLLPLDEDLTPEGAGNAFEVGDVLFGKLRPYLAKAWCAEFDGVCSTEFLVLKPNSYEREYLLQLLLTNGFISHVDSSTQGAKMPRASWDFIGDSVLPLPPLDEQRDIAAFLDRETARIDSLVAKKRLLIERLQEYRKALITRTVTRGLPPEAARAAGLDPSPRLKPTGVEWLGDVPEHWDVKRVHDCSVIQTGPFGSQLHAHDYLARGIPVINPANIVGSHLIRDDDMTVSEEKARELSRHMFRAGDIAFGRRGEMSRRALVRYHHLPALCGTGLLLIRPDQEVVQPTFLWFWLGLEALKSWLEVHAVGATLANLNESIVGALPVLLPPLDEQEKLVSFLSGPLSQVDALQGKVQRAIERLQEYRTALITAAVMGKIDVRDESSVTADRAE